MAQRKQGRRTAEEAERTKLEILASAAFLFCEKGYNQVSIRDISEDAGVTHSLIRHYFGTKVQIWRAIIEEIHDFVDAYSEKLEALISSDLPDNERLYRYLSHFMAYMLKKPQLVQIMLDYIHHPENEAAEGEEFSPHIQELVHRAYCNMPNIVSALAINPSLIMWRFLIHAGGVVAFKPFMTSAWPGLSYDEGLLEHWKLYERDLVSEFNIGEKQRLTYSSIEDLVIKVAVLDEETEKFYQDKFNKCL